MKLQTLKNGFLGSDEGESFEVPYQEAKTVIIPFGFEATVSYGGGTKNGPKAIIEASHQVEVTDEQTRKPVYKSGIVTLEQPSLPKDTAEAMLLLEIFVRQVLNDGKFPIVLGGEHSITQGTIAALVNKYKDISILHFDAHMDLRPKYHGSHFSHASVMHRALTKWGVKNIVQVGIRNFSPTEIEFYKKNKNKIKTFWAWEKIKATQVVSALKSKNVFISFDVDAFDPSIMPSTGTPEPGGLQWWETLDILKKVFSKKNVVGADVVELAPVKNFHAPDFLTARLVYKLISYRH